MSSKNGKVNGHINPRPGRFCDKCGRVCYRSNMVRAWPIQNPGHRAGWVRVIQRLCTYCYKSPDAISLLHNINPQWKPLKAMERITGFTMPKK